MGKGSLALIVLSFLFTQAAFSAKAPPKIYYRIIHTSPAEFVSAITSPYVEPPKAPKGGKGKEAAKKSQEKAGRLSKVFKIIKKDIADKKIKIDIKPNIPVPSLESKAPVIHILLERLANEREDIYRFKGTFQLSEGSFVHTLLKISPDKKGARLDILVEDSSYPKAMMWSFSKLAVSLGFLTEKKDS